MKIIIFALCFTSLYSSITASWPDVYTPKCELAMSIRRHGIEKTEIATWLCIVEKTSFYIPRKTVKLDKTYWGYFQFGSSWCDVETNGGRCNVKCDELLRSFDENVKCAIKVYEKRGYEGFGLKISKDCANKVDRDVDACLQ